MISKSPGRLTFQKEKYIERCKEKGEDPNPEYLEMYDNDLERYDKRFKDKDSRKGSLEYDLLTTGWILAKARASDDYAQNIYAALCNNDFVELKVIPILTNTGWSCSWRYAGGIVADMRREGDYIDWYCSGICGGWDTEDDISENDPKGYVPEGKITDEIREDFKQLGWAPLPGGDWEKFE